MALLVVTYPQLVPAEHAWVQTIRQQHDPHYTLIAPHFTLVFPVDGMPQRTVLAQVAAQAKHARRIPFTIRCATIVKDVFSPLTHVFLVPDVGYSALVKLHDALYTGPLAPALRLDIPFIPHITIGAHADPYVCKALADDINHHDLHLRGEISALDIITYEHTSVAPVRTIALG